MSTTVHPRAGGERLTGSGKPRQPVGSSPRGRGTPRHIPSISHDGRFIPARAGNASNTPTRPRAATVHPRAGGERCGQATQADARLGSSPRGRGTLGSCSDSGGGGRFIPARAGNARTLPPGRQRVSVHPRAGGERLSNRAIVSLPNGSSPRGRGTLILPVQLGADHRFIPARAGNAGSRVPPGTAPSVHPRAGGERAAPCPCRTVLDGSSPRGRGTLFAEGVENATVYGQALSLPTC